MAPTEVFESREKEGEGPLEAHAESDNTPCTCANPGKVPYEDPGTGVVEEPSEGTPEDTQDPGQHPAPSTQAQAP